MSDRFSFPRAAAGIVFLALMFVLAPPSAEAANATPLPGTQVIKTKSSFAGLRKKLEAAVQANKMYVVARASASGGGAGRGIEILGNLVIGVYRNDFAVRMLKASVASGIEAPLRFYVTENSDGTAPLTYREPSAIFALYDNADLTKMAKELDAIWRRIAVQATGG
ncbi:MAG: hypothetical protein CFH40_02033 [Alphaproteobacteria bacterium MarineAlpha10_Bin3]|nr:MAG: hypothetical protein CFH40_02033 [Alphaproteobacteria bacterium MarineAlpha10_Bin3]PPR68430.1 MAG: hypothetical protein CFH09_02033 [Alphaproteobacteria bacterium MarineAlpha4_Bin1]